MTQEEFDQLAEWWNKETWMMASPGLACDHPAAVAITEAGMDAVPFILKEMEEKDETPFWFVILYRITGVDHAKGEVSVSGAEAKWIEWGKREGHIP